MDVERIKEVLVKQPGLSKTLGMTFLSTPEDDVCVGEMPVTDNNLQPYGFLSGGATLALAETVAGVGSCTLCPDDICVGMNVNCNHVHSAVKGEKVIATARLIHKGRQTHVWQVDINNQDNKLISSISVTNFILKKK